MTKIGYMTALVALTLATAFAVHHAYGEEKITVSLRVLDDMGSPVKGARATIGFPQTGSAFDTKEGETDDGGLFSHRAEVHSYVVFSVDKVGYYGSTGKLKPYRMDGSTPVLEKGELVYEDQRVDVVLNKERNPIPLFAKSLFSIMVPKMDEPIGFDMEVMDWIQPFGKGSRADLFFTVKGTLTSPRTANQL